MIRLLGIAMLALAGTVASTAIAAESASVHGACKADLEKLCKGVEPGGGRLAQCMKQHEAELSEACKTQRTAKHEERKNRRKAMREACQGDIEKLCADKRGGKGDIMRCLKEHKAELSTGCSDAMPTGRPGRPEKKAK